MTHLVESRDILKDFPPVPTKAWEASIHVDLKGEDYNKKLVWNSDEGIEVRPYYRSEDIKDLESRIGKIPATFPFVRGRGSQSWKQVESQGEVAADAIRVDAIHEQGAKLRAARMLWARAVSAFQPGDESSCLMNVHACTALCNKSIYDPFASVLRATTEAITGEQR